MRLAASILSAVTLGATLVGVAVPPLRAAEFGTREEAMAMVQRVEEKFKREGAEATFRAINSKALGFVDRDLFPFVHKLDGTLCVANGVTPAVRGRNLHDLKDQDGKFLVQEFVKIANNPPGHGWSDYRWLNPVTGTIEDKSAFIERMGDYLVGVGVGVYRNEQPNENTIGLISGSPNSDDTYLQMAYDLADVLNDGENLRVLPIAGVGGTRNIRDVRYLRGVDVGLTQTNVLNSFRRSNERLGQSDDKLVYIAKLFNEEVHLVAGPNITSISQLKGLKVNVDADGSGTSYSMRDLFKVLEIDVEEVGMSQLEAIEKVRSGEIAATALIAGKPVRSMSRLSRKDGLHLVPLPYPTKLIGDYLPTTLTHDDYPDLVAPGETVDTVAVGAVMITYNWPKTNPDRYRRIQKFVETFFPKIAELQKPPHHPKWREVNLAAMLPGWQRFEAAQAWLDSQRGEHQRSSANNGDNSNNEPPAADQAAAARQAATSGSGARPAGVAEQPRQQRVDPALYQEFLRWRQMRGR
jgi:TRAP-type uncharacterized transport system substrate-binding protein